MLKVTFLIDPRTGADAKGIREALAYDVEKYGDIKAMSVKDTEAPQQMKMGPPPGDMERITQMADEAIKRLREAGVME